MCIFAGLAIALRRVSTCILCFWRVDSPIVWMMEAVGSSLELCTASSRAAAVQARLIRTAITRRIAESVLGFKWSLGLVAGCGVPAWLL